MAPKRKSPPRKRQQPPKQRLVTRVLLAGAAAINRNVARHPRLVAGAVCFFVVFGLVSANALWYQPGQHPSPFLRTRDAADTNLIAGVRAPPALDPERDGVTTFRIEREGDPAANPEAAGTQAAPAADAVSLTRAVQVRLIARGYYSGTADGVAGPMTSTAIANFQKSVGMDPTGEATPEVLAALEVAQTPPAMPLPRPNEDLDAPEAAEDPVAAAILNAERTLVTAPDAKPAPKPSTPRAPNNAARDVNADGTQLASRGDENRRTPGATAASAASGDANTPAITNAMADPEMVLQIQRGLANIAYAEVTVDGVAGEQTRAAIRHFERHYRLPETGEPSEKVLKKLQSIGAL